MKITHEEANFIMHKNLDGHGEIGVMRFGFTTALCCHISTNTVDLPYQYRYCYENYSDCIHDFENWDGEGHPRGNWIKRKGAAGGDMPNPKRID